MNLFGNYLKEFLEKKGYKLEYAADEIGVSFGLLGHYINGRRSPSYKFLEKFFKAFNINELQQRNIMKMVETDKMPEELKKLKEEKKDINYLSSKDDFFQKLNDPIKMITIPVFCSVAAGIGRIPDIEPIDYISIPEVSGECIAIKVEGDSMEPTFYSGDLIVLKKEVEVSVGEIGVFLNKITGETVVKRLKYKNGVHVLESDNHLFKDIEVKTDEIFCCGKVINIIKKDLRKRVDPLYEMLDKLEPSQRDIIELMVKGLLEKK